MSTTLPYPGADETEPRNRDAAQDPAADGLPEPFGGGVGDPDPIAPLGDGVLRRVEVAGTTFDELKSLGDGLWRDVRLRPTGGGSDRSFPFRFASVGDAEVTLRLFSLGAGLLSEIDRLDDYVVTWFRAGGGAVTVRGNRFDFPAGRPAVMPSAEPFDLEVSPGRQSLVHLARPFLDRIATERHGGPVQPIAFQYSRPTSEAATASWQKVVSQITPVVTDPSTPPLMRMEANLSLARSMLDVFPWHTQHVPPAFLKARLSRVREAVEFLHENAHHPIAPADAAAAVGLHTRSLQTAFQRHLGKSPTEYLRCVRLDRARRDLVQHNPDTATVSDLARAWGFGNLGRFASAYQDRFGEKPNETLRRPSP